jgi:hypothetical protein
LSLIVYAALIASIVVIQRHGLGQALLRVYLPMLLMLPNGFFATTPGHPSFNQAAMVPLFLFTVARLGRTWKPTFLDILMIAFATEVGLSDYLSRGYADAQSLMLAMLTQVMAPYLVARLVIPAERLHVAVGRQWVMLTFIVALIGLFEFKFAFNPFIVYIGRLFPGQMTGWSTTFRHGLPRVAGPYAHAILAGIMMVIAYRVQRWLHDANCWEPRFKWWPGSSWTKAQIITRTLFVAALMTIARGPWIGGIVAAAITMVGGARDRRRALAIAGTVVAIGAIGGFYLMQSYLDIRPGVKMTDSQESAMYRKVLFEQYFDRAMDHAWLGWGLTTWPKVRGMESIDNYFLLLSLQHGVTATVLLMTIMVTSSARLIIAGLREPVGAPTPAFMFAGISVALFVSLGTVYLGEQVLPAYFFMIGWAEGWRQNPKTLVFPGRKGQATSAATPAGHTAAGNSPVRPRGGFRGVIA